VSGELTSVPEGGISSFYQRHAAADNPQKYWFLAEILRGMRDGWGGPVRP
jgi:hypothetical protein